MDTLTTTPGVAFPIAGAIAPPSNGLCAPAIPISFAAFEREREISIPPSACSWEGFRAWAVSEAFPKHGRITFAGGELLIDMSPESFEEQGAVKTEVCRVLAQLVRQHRLGHFRIDRTLVSHQSAGLSNEPDAMFLSRETINSDRIEFIPEVDRPQSSKEIVGTVDWVLEIISPSSRRKDSKVLRDAYFKAGVPEYWLIDPTDEATLDFQILVRGPSGYILAQSQDGWQVSPTFARSFRLTRERDADGYWEYTLDMKE